MIQAARMEEGDLIYDGDPRIPRLERRGEHDSLSYAHKGQDRRADFRYAIASQRAI
jgi:hypothetical protein